MSVQPCSAEKPPEIFFVGSFDRWDACNPNWRAFRREQRIPNSANLVGSFPARFGIRVPKAYRGTSWPSLNRCNVLAAVIDRNGEGQNDAHQVKVGLDR